MEHVVEEAVLLIPKTYIFITAVVHCAGDMQKVLPKFACHILIGRIFLYQFHGNSQQVQSVHGHPAGTVRLSNMASRRQWSTTIKDADIVETEKATLKDVHPISVFAVHPPGEVQQQLLKNAFEEYRVAHAMSFFFNLVNAPGSPGVYRRIDVPKSPLICRQLSVRVHVPFP